MCIMIVVLLYSHVLSSTEPLPCLVPQIRLPVHCTLQALLLQDGFLPVKFAMVVLALPIHLMVLLVSVLDGVIELRIKGFNFKSPLRHAIFFAVTLKICTQNRLSH